MLELKNICVSFRSERQDKIFGHTRQQVLFDISPVSYTHLTLPTTPYV